MDENLPIGVIGAGPAGLTAAYELARRGLKVELFEAQESVGGMAKSLRLWGQIVDLGPHRFFSTDPRVNKIWLDIAGGRYDMIDRLTRIYYGRKFFDYPLKPLNAFANLGPLETARCVASYLLAKLQKREPDANFEEWVTQRFGRRLFEIFFKSYSEKLWGLPCAELDADFAVQRIKKLSLFEAVKSAFLGNRARHKTLVDQFAYPLEGTGYIYERMAERIRELGGTIHFNARVRAVRCTENETVLEMETGETKNFSHIVSSMPVTILVDRMQPPENIRAAAAQLRFRNTILVYLEIEGAGLFPDLWIYVHAPDLLTGRITNFRNWLPNKDAANTILCMEYWCNDGDEMWSGDQSALTALAEKEIRKTGLIGARAILNSKLVKLPRCYPVYKRGYKDQLKPVERYLSQFKNLSVIGRYGAFKYNNQDHSILMGHLAAENIAEGKRHDLWQINTDYEYQESSLITKTGLQKIETP